jgi:hypothetical protein
MTVWLGVFERLDIHLEAYMSVDDQRMESTSVPACCGWAR